MSRILVVDDLRENSYYLEALLRGHGMVVETARHGAEALTLARRQRPDLIVSDLLMPVMDGYSLLRHCKSDERLRGVPFVVYTATYTTPDDERLAMGLGADAFILKPAEPEEFVARIRGLLDAPLDAPPAGPSHPADDPATLALHNEVLVRKLGEKMMQLEDVNRILRADLLELQRMEQALRESESLLRMAGRVGRLGAWTVELPEKVVTWSDEIRAILDVDASFEPNLDRMLGFPAPESREQLRAALDECARDGAPFDLELHALSATGRKLCVRVLGEAVRAAHGGILRVQGALQDVTERKRLEEQFRQTQRLESLGTLAGGVAHDLNNALSPIVMSVGLLKRGEEDPARRSLLDGIERSAQRGADMVRQVLSFARGVEGPRSRVSLAEVADEVRKLAKDGFPENVEVTVETAPDLWRVHADPTQMHQVLMNLCLNARDAMPRGGRIVIRLENVEPGRGIGGAAPGPRVRLEVTDTGEGMSRDVLSRVFEPFFTTKEVGKGTGLGLSTARTIVRSHQGSIHARSEPGQGTTFEVLLPALAGAPGPPSAEPGEAASEAPGALVLVVDDEETIRTTLATLLEHHGHRVLLASNGAEAVAAYARHRDEIAAVVTDMAMPVMDGVHAIRAMKSINPDVRIVAMSGLASQDSAAKATAAGAGTFLAKPCTPDALLKALRDVVARRA